jgi:urate oxidase
MAAQMGPNRYGKSGIRLATVSRDADRHTFTDLEVSVRLSGDFDAAHLEGDNSAVLPTDTMRGTCYALAREHGVADVAAFGRLLAARFLEASPAVGRAAVELVAFGWERVEVDGARHEHTFRPSAGGQQVTVVDQERGAEPAVTGGVRGLRVLKTTGSAFSGFLRDDLTTLPETRDRIMATTVAARWGYLPGEVDHGRLVAEIPATSTARFATHDESESVQHTLHAMGTAVLDAHPDVAWIGFRMPNEHHILADLSPYGLDNPGEVFLVADRPFGVIEGTVVREGVQAPDAAW